MPYIITTTGPDPADISQYDPHIITTRTAVATLEEARLTVASIYDGFTYTDVEAAMDNCWEAENLPTGGKTIGPLPDGTVIEVRKVSDLELRRRVGRPSFRGPTREVIAAFNA